MNSRIEEYIIDFSLAMAREGLDCDYSIILPAHIFECLSYELRSKTRYKSQYSHVSLTLNTPTGSVTIFRSIK